MKANESSLSFHSRLSAQAACCNWTEQEERSVVRDLFIGRIRDSDVQSTLIRKNPDSAGTLKLALESEKGASTSMEFQKLMRHNKNAFFLVCLKQNRSQLFPYNRVGLVVNLLSADRTHRIEKIKTHLGRVTFVVIRVHLIIEKINRHDIWNAGHVRRKDI